MDRRFDFSDASDAQEVALNPYEYYFRKGQKYATFLLPAERQEGKHEKQSAVREPPSQNGNYREEVEKLSQQYKQQLLRARKRLAHLAANAHSPQTQRELDSQVWCCDEICKNVDRVLSYAKQQPPKFARAEQPSRPERRTKSQARGQVFAEALVPARPAELFFGLKAELAFLKRRPLGLLIPDDDVYVSGCEVQKSAQHADLEIQGAYLPRALYAPRLRAVIQQNQCTTFEVFAAYAVAQHFCRAHGLQLLDFNSAAIVSMSYLVDNSARQQALLYVFLVHKNAVRKEPVCAFPLPHDGQRFATPRTLRTQQEPGGFAMIDFECAAACQLAAKLLREIKKMLIMHA